MKPFPPLRAFFMSFYSRKLYREVGRDWRGAGLLYLFTLLLVAFTPIVVKVQLGFSEWIDREASDVVGRIPRITIASGEVPSRTPRVATVEGASERSGGSLESGRAVN
jgi:hypothetical protein